MIRLQKNKFLISTLILCGGGFVVKILSFIIKILYTRILGTEGISLYSLIMPFFSLMVTIAGFGMPQAISKLIAEGKTRSRKIIEQSIIFLLILNFICVILIILSSNFISTTLLHEPRTKVLIIAAVLAMPNMALACTLKGYFYGKQRMLPNNISNCIEQTIRLLFIIFILPNLVKKNLVLGIMSFLLLNIVTETASIITFLILLPKNAKLKLTSISYSPPIFKELFKSSMPLVSSRIIGNIGYFFEPIILSNTLLYIGYSSSFFVLEYGIYNSYSLALLLMPSFLIQAICTSIIPEVSKFYSQKKLNLVRLRTKQAIFISSFIGLITVIFVTIFRKFLLGLIYNTNLGANYILALSPFFTFYYLEAPISSILQGLGYGSYTLKTTTIGVFLKLASLFIFSLLHIGLYGLVISEALNIFFVVFKNGSKLKSILKEKTL